MTITELHPTTTKPQLEIVNEPVHDIATQNCKQIVWDTTGKRPAWVIYDPEQIAAVAHLSNPTHSTRFLLGLAKYQHQQTIDSGELWTKRANQ